LYADILGFFPPVVEIAAGNDVSLHRGVVVLAPDHETATPDFKPVEHDLRFTGKLRRISLGDGVRIVDASDCEICRRNGPGVFGEEPYRGSNSADNEVHDHNSAQADRTPAEPRCHAVIKGIPQ